jgi:uncharacterized membrane protein HdeD (DUF308 family)
VLTLRGVIAILFGVLALMVPGITLLGLIALFAAYALLGGAVSVFAAIRNKTDDDYWWLLLLWGLVSIGAGVMAVAHPGLSTLILVLVIGANALITGVLDIVAAFRLRKVVKGEWLMALSGVVSIVFGALLFLFPGPGALALVWVIGAYAVITGGILLGVAIRLQSQTRTRNDGEERRVRSDRRVSHAHA